MKMDLGKFASVVSIVLLVLLAPALGDIIPWDGEISNVWFVEENWVGDVRPVEDDDVVDDVGPTIEYDDVAFPLLDDPGIATFTGSGAGTYALTLEEKATLTVKTNMAYSGTGTYTVDVGDEALISIGDGREDFDGPFAATTSGFDWIVRGFVHQPLDQRGVVEVTDRIFGSGEWTTESGRVSVGNDALGLPGRIESKPSRDREGAVLLRERGPLPHGRGSDTDFLHIVEDSVAGSRRAILVENSKNILLTSHPGRRYYS